MVQLDSVGGILGRHEIYGDPRQHEIGLLVGSVTALYSAEIEIGYIWSNKNITKLMNIKGNHANWEQESPIYCKTES